MSKIVTKNDVALYFKTHTDFPRFARLVSAIGNQLNDAQLRFIKALIFESSIQCYSQQKITYIGNVGCDLIIPELNNARVEMKFEDSAVFTDKGKNLKPTITAKLMNSLGTNGHKDLPDDYADFLIVIGSTGAILFDKETLREKEVDNDGIEQFKYLKFSGDGISLRIHSSRGIVLANPLTMVPSNNHLDFIDGLTQYIHKYINSVQ